MSHEITKNDGVVFADRAAWHGLGTVVDGAMDSATAARLAKLEWSVSKRPAGYLAADGSWAPVNGVYHVVRDDIQTSLGTVSKGYKPVQNRALFDFADMLAGEGGLQIESAGSIRGGQKVWALCRAESIDFGTTGDTVVPYVLVANGHDGKTGFHVTPTTIRVVCSNTLHMVLPGENSRLRTAGFSFHHDGDVRSKIREAKAALRLFADAKEATADAAARLAAKQLDDDAIKAMLVDLYRREIDPVPAIIENDRDAKRRERGVESVREMLATFRFEAESFGPTAWVALNAFTGWTQKRSHLAKSAERAASANLFGVNARRGLTAMDHVLGLVS